MFNHIRWRISKDNPRAHGSEPFATAEDAVAEACPLLTLSLYDIWIECADGTRIDVNEILRQCRSWGHVVQAPIGVLSDSK